MTRPAILERLKGVKRAGAGWLAFCPVHADRQKQSLSVNLGDDGRTLLHCFVGCETEDICRAVDMTLADLAPPSTRENPPRGSKPTLTLAAFARAKGLPADFLKACGVTEDERGLSIAYYLADGALAPRQRRRTALVAKDGSSWEGPKGAPLVPYGLEDLDAAREHGELVLGEGETDRLSAKYHNVPCLTLPGADMSKLLTAEHVRDIERLYIVREPDEGGATFVRGVEQRLAALAWRAEAFVLTLPCKDLNDLHREYGERFAEELARAKAEAAPLRRMAPSESEPVPVREGLDLAVHWRGLRFALTRIHDGREGVRGELTVTRDGRRLWRGAVNLLVTRQRAELRKELERLAPAVAWAEDLDSLCFALAEAARQGEPLVTLTGQAATPTRELVPGVLYEAEPTSLHADGDTGKSLVAATIAVAVQSGIALPFGLKPARAVPAAILDWETSRETVDQRVALIAAGFGVGVPPILYKRMTRPLVDEAATLAADFARRGIGLVIIDSMMFAVAGGEGAAFHEPITALYNALRWFAPAASLVLNHVTNADAKSGAPARPYGGAFAFNAPRLIWEAKRDRDVTDGTAIAFTCTKANNLPRKPDPFGLLFKPGEGTITVYPFDLKDAAPHTVAGASLPYRVRLALATADLTTAELAEHLNVNDETLARVLRRLATSSAVVKIDASAGGRGHAARWRLATS